MSRNRLFQSRCKRFRPRNSPRLSAKSTTAGLNWPKRGIQKDGAPVTFRITYPAKGGVVTVIDGEGTEGLNFIETLVGPGN